MIEAWFGIQQSVADQAIDQWRVMKLVCYETYIQLFLFDNF